MSEQLQEIKKILAPWTQSIKDTIKGFDVVVSRADLLSVVQRLQEAQWGYLAAITGLDAGSDTGQLEILYHFCSGADTVTLRLLVDRTAPHIDSLCSLIPSASLLERELSEMFGIVVVGTPNPAHLFLPDDWPENLYPLRKDAAVKETA